MIIDNDIVFNIVQDWKKREITGEQKVEFFRLLLEERKVSQRELAKQLDVPYSTLHDWITNRQMKKYYKQKDAELDFLIDRLTFLLSRPFKPSEKTFDRIKRLQSELDKVMGLSIV